MKGTHILESQIYMILRLPNMYDPYVYYYVANGYNNC